MSVPSVQKLGGRSNFGHAGICPLHSDREVSGVSENDTTASAADIVYFGSVEVSRTISTENCSPGFTDEGPLSINCEPEISDAFFRSSNPDFCVL